MGLGEVEPRNCVQQKYCLGLLETTWVRLLKGLRQAKFQGPFSQKILCLNVKYKSIKVKLKT